MSAALTAASAPSPVFAGADGDVKPLSTIIGPSPRYNPHSIPSFHLGAIAVDPTGNIYVATISAGESEESILVYPAHASGNAKPVATISGDDTCNFRRRGHPQSAHVSAPRRK